MSLARVACRVVGLWLAAGVAVSASRTAASLNDQSRASLLAERTRLALGVTQAKLRSVILSGYSEGGRYSDLTGKLRPGQVPVEFRLLLPDSYVRIDQPNGAVIRRGVSEGRPILSQEAVGPGAYVSPAVPTPDLLPFARSDLFRLAVGLFAVEQFGTERANVTARGSATLEFTGLANRVLLDVDSRSGLPRRARYKQLVVMAESIQRTLGISLAEDGSDEVAMEYSDRVVVDGVSLPRVWQRVVSGAKLERITLTTIRINPPLSARDFRF